MSRRVMFRKAVGSALAAGVILVSPACGGSTTPGQRVEEFLQSTLDGDFEAACEMGVNENRVPLEEGMAQWEECVDGISESADYSSEVQAMIDANKKTEIDGDTAEVTIHYRDVEPVGLVKIDGEWFIQGYD